jgi:DNA-binding NarL/FixJ family response regulator
MDFFFEYPIQDLIKSSGTRCLRDLITAVETLGNHKPFFSPVTREVILGDFNGGGSRTEVPGTIRNRLTSREREVVQLLAEGMSSKEVASSLSISVKTAKNSLREYHAQIADSLRK